jgi:oligopeptide/dipeptide ABC transporter ATP-binding protein
MSAVVAVGNLVVSYAMDDGEVFAVDGVDLDIGPGESVGIVGESGSGKSTLGMAIGRLLAPNARFLGGEIRVAGRSILSCPAAELRQVRRDSLGFVYQNPMSALDPTMRVGRQVALAIGGRAGPAEIEALLGRVGLPDPARAAAGCAHELSGGMAQRVVMAIALICDPRFVISDDATSGLDVTVQTQVLELLQRLVARHRTAMLIITRDIGITAHFCDRVAVIYSGEIVEIASKASFFATPMHPYTVLLLAAFSHNPRLRSYWIKGGTAEDRAPATAGCAFAPRCVRARPNCSVEHPPLREMSPGHSVRCHYPVEH